MNREVDRSFQLYVSTLKCITESGTCAWHTFESLFYLRSTETFEYVCKQDLDPVGWILNELGAHYIWIVPDYREAFRYFSRAAEHNHAYALLFQAKMLWSGDGCQKNVKKAIECAERALSK